MSLVAKRYAQALFSSAVDKNLVDEIYEDFSTVADILNSEKELMALMMTPSMAVAEKKEILNRVFGKSLNLYVKNFLCVLLDKNRFECVLEIQEAFKGLVLPYKNIVEARVITAVPLKEEQRVALENKLEKRFNKKVILENCIDKSIIGGAVVFMEDQVIDGSIKNQLVQMKTQMSQTRLH